MKICSASASTKGCFNKVRTTKTPKSDLASSATCTAHSVRTDIAAIVKFQPSSAKMSGTPIQSHHINSSKSLTTPGWSRNDTRLSWSFCNGTFLPSTCQAFNSLPCLPLVKTCPQMSSAARQLPRRSWTGHGQPKRACSPHRSPHFCAKGRFGAWRSPAS